MTDPTAPAAAGGGFQVLRPRAAAAKLGCSRATLYRLVAAGALPRPIRLSPNMVGWLAHEIDAWIAGRIAERDAQAPEVPR
jgi:prophage regulatory protein